MNLEDWRNDIDAIDRQIVRLINQRIRIVRKIGEIKCSTGMPAIDRERENRVLENICGTDPDGLNDAAIKRIFREIIRESRGIQRPLSESRTGEAVQTRC